MFQENEVINLNYNFPQHCPFISLKERNVALPSQLLRYCVLFVFNIYDLILFRWNAYCYWDTQISMKARLIRDSNTVRASQLINEGEFKIGS